MRYLLELKYRTYVQGYGFLSFTRKFGDTHGKKRINTATKTGVDAAKPASKEVVQKTAEATGDLIANKIGDKITSLAKSKNKQKEREKKDKTNEVEEVYIVPELRQQIIDDLKLF